MVAEAEPRGSLRKRRRHRRDSLHCPERAEDCPHEEICLLPRDRAEPLKRLPPGAMMPVERKSGCGTSLRFTALGIDRARPILPL